MKTKIQDIIDAVDFDNDMTEFYLNIKTGEVCMYSEEELRAAEDNGDMSDSPEWYRDAVEQAKQFMENQDDYMELPGKYDFNEYRVMETFSSLVVVEEQSEILLDAIKGKGAFHRFKETIARFALTNQWYDFKEKKLYEFVESWCQENKIEFE